MRTLATCRHWARIARPWPCERSLASPWYIVRRAPEYHPCSETELRLEATRIAKILGQVHPPQLRKTRRRLPGRARSAEGLVLKPFPKARGASLWPSKPCSGRKGRNFRRLQAREVRPGRSRSARWSFGRACRSFGGGERSFGRVGVDAGCRVRRQGGQMGSRLQVTRGSQARGPFRSFARQGPWCSFRSAASRWEWQPCRSTCALRGPA